MSPRYSLITAVVLSVAVGACSESGQPGSPIAPSVSSQSTQADAPVSPAPALLGATIDGAVAGAAAESVPFRGAGSSLTVTVAGTAISALVGADGRFRLSGVPPGDVRLQFTGGGVECTLTIAAVQNGEQITITLTVAGSGATLESEHRTCSDQTAELEGKITAADPVAGTIEVADALVEVPADAAIRHGSTPMQLSDLVVGARVHVNGTRNGTTVTAREIQIQSVPAAPKTEIELTGWISAVAAGCPKPLFSLNGVQVATASADFQRGDCTDVKVGQRVIVKGVKRDASTLDATRVRVEDLEIEVDGTISAVSGCPTARLTVDGTVIAATGSTTFKAGACADLAVGVKTRARGAKQADGSMVAYWIWPDVVRRETAEITGVVSGLSGTCPALSFTVTPKSLTSMETVTTTSRSVTTGAATEFRDTTCAALKNGDAVYVKGTAQVKSLTTDGPIAATLVQKSSVSSQTTVEMTGTIDGLSGSCPNLKFTLVSKGLWSASTVTTTTRSVLTNSCTTFSGVTCAALKNGDSVYVKGTVQVAGCTTPAGAPVTATLVKRH
jgi:hypothetical protein